MEGSVRPFLKWAGGKRWLAQANALPQVPPGCRYFEPFLGSAAIFFSIRPARAVLSDANRDVIELYKVVRDHPGDLKAALRTHDERHCPEHYYRVRAAVPTTAIGRAARMLYLNRTCWNGLYRVNRKGEFNVPIGTKTKVLMDDDFEAIGVALSVADLRCCDFAESIREAGAGDLVYADPPYTVRHNANGFLKYNEQIFSWDDQVRLRDEAVNAAHRGATVIISNADHHSLHDIYRGIANYHSLARSSVISGTSASRGQVTEALFVIKPPGEEAPIRDQAASIPARHATP